MDGAFREPSGVIFFLGVAPPDPLPGPGGVLIGG